MKHLYRNEAGRDSLMERRAGLTTGTPVHLLETVKIHGLRRLVSDLLLRWVHGAQEQRRPLPAHKACRDTGPLPTYRSAGQRRAGKAGITQRGRGVCSCVMLKVGAVVHKSLFHLLCLLL